MENRILGLDLGSGSIGWAIIREGEDVEIIAIGSRIIPIDGPDITKFNQGQTISKCEERTQKRTQRKGYDRYQLRRENLTAILRELNMLPSEDLIKLRSLDLWGLRAKACRQQISLQELGRILYHINQKRGYKSSRKEESSSEKKDTEYVAAVNSRYDILKQEGKTIGEHLYDQLKNDQFFRCKDNVYPRKAYVEEYDKIMACQKEFHQEVLTDKIIAEIRDNIIFYQRPLKSCKRLVSTCEFSLRPHENIHNGKIMLFGPKVAPKSSPLFQISKIWQSINNITLKDKTNDTLYISLESKNKIFEHLNTKKNLSFTDLLKILGLKKTDGWYGNKMLQKGIQGNTTYYSIANALEGKYNNLLDFNLKEVDSQNVDEETGEIYREISVDFEAEPLYRLWHVIYSIADKKNLEDVLKNKFGIKESDIIENLCRLDFVKADYGNMSSKALRKIIPYLREGKIYSEACESAGFRHSESLTKEENKSRILKDAIEPLAKGSLRQPIVEKILNQMINVVNALMMKYGRFDEIRVELARELQQSKDERYETDKRIRQNQRDNEAIAVKIKDHGITPTKRAIQKYKIWEETGQRCIYCGKQIGMANFLNGTESEVEHIIPKALLFNNSMSNKTCSCRACNQAKSSMTAYDYMKGKKEAEFNEYVNRINSLNFSKAKRNFLLMPAEKIPTDFITRQLNETRYITRKAMELLRDVCFDVHATSGSITDFIRHTWGWDMILQNLNLEKYRKANLTEYKEWEEDGYIHKGEIIKNWSKRLDQRHHAIDALVIACTKQGFIQRINNLSTSKDEKFAPIERQSNDQKIKHTNLQKYILYQPHLSTATVKKAVDNILISYKAGKKVTTPGKRYTYKDGKRTFQQSSLVPRGALHKESVYGENLYYVKKKDNTAIERRSVIKYPLLSIEANDLEYIVDKHIKEVIKARLSEFGDKPKQAFAEPLYADKEKKIVIKTVRCFTGLNSAIPLKYNDQGEPISFVAPGNNHHIAIYEDENGKPQENAVTFWHAIERKRYGVPIIITNPEETWENLFEKDIPETFLAQLPNVKWKYKTSLQQNEMFILNMPEEDYQYAMENKDNAMLSKYLYRVQKITSKDYYFRHHLETSSDDKYDEKTRMDLSKLMNKLIRISSIKGFIDTRPHKVRISLIGEISEVK